MNDATTPGFSADWLRQREPLDLAARSRALALGFRAALPRHEGHPVKRIIDLACGSGANFRALAPVLGGDQDWRLIDHDPRLLAEQRSEITTWASQRGWRCQEHDGALLIDTGDAHWSVRGQQLDLARSLEAIDLAGCDGLVTTAFLDLVSAQWLDRLSALLARVRRPLLATLTVDGQRTWRPGRPDDQVIAAAFLAHQGGDKGFGPSLGVHATAHLAAKLTAEGYQVSTEASHWHIGPQHGAMLLTLAREAAAAAGETLPAASSQAAAWLAERSADLAQGRLSLQVGHLDLLAVPQQPEKNP